MNNSDINNNSISNESLKNNSKKVLWRKHSSHLPGSILLVSDSSEFSQNQKNISDSKNPKNNLASNNSSKEFFDYIFIEKNWTENLLTGDKTVIQDTVKDISKQNNNLKKNQQNNINIDNNNNINTDNFNNSKVNINQNNNIVDINKEKIVESEEELENNSINNINSPEIILNTKNAYESSENSLEINDELNLFKKKNNNKADILHNTNSEIENFNIKEEIIEINKKKENNKLEDIKRKEIFEKENSETDTNNMEENTEYSIHKIKQFEELLTTPNIDLVKLRKLSWSGIPKKFRPMVWQLLMGYLPRNQDRREVTLQRKRKDFADTANQAFSKGVAGLDYTLYHQIHIDIPRTNPSCSLYQNKKIQKSLERILYCWAIRHPASGYVQGINDLVTPFYYVFLSSYIEDGDLETYNLDLIPDNVFEAVEADSFWCLTNLLDGIQDSYTYNQPGIHRQVQKLEEFIKRVDLKLYNHFKKEDVQFIQFAFRWMNCLLMRELKLEHTIRMWDTYQSEPEGFSEFHLYVCAAFLVKWSKQLLEMDFQDIMIFLQNLPTSDWTEKDIEMLLSEAYMWKCLFHDSPNHIS